MQDLMARFDTGLWWVVLLEGIAILILGILLLIAPGMTTLVLVQFVGIYWLVSGIFSIVEIFVGDKRTHWGWLLFFGILGILAGLVVLRHPLASAILIPTFIVIYLGITGIIMGITSLIHGFQGRGGWAIVLGIVDILIGLVLLFRPLYGAVLLPIFVGALAIIGGILLIVFSFRIRSSTPREPATI
jgi:uncharacterized membrane protein HdeD (DUF308 family)